MVLKPTMSAVPFVGGLQLCFLDTPTINFDFDGLADIADWPFLRRKAMKHAILDHTPS